MPEFKALELADREIFLNYLKQYDYNTYEYSFLNLYFWRKLCQVEYAVVTDALVIRKTEEKKGPYFMQPVGYAPGCLQDIVSQLIKIKQSDPEMRFLFRDVEEPFLEELRAYFGENLECDEDVNNFDYIYEQKQLASLLGQKLRKRRAQYNQFASGYHFTVRDIYDRGVIEDCMEVSKVWLESQGSVSRELILEADGIRDVLMNAEALGALGMAVYVGDRIAGFTIGEKVNERMAIIHIEKADVQYKGVYAFINKTFAESYLEGVTYINRQEDMGIEGLRQAKSAYNPIKLEKKYMVNLL